MKKHGLKKIVHVYEFWVRIYAACLEEAVDESIADKAMHFTELQDMCRVCCRLFLDCYATRFLTELRPDLALRMDRVFILLVLFFNVFSTAITWWPI